MFRRYLPIFLLIILLLVISIPAAAHGGHGIDNMRGRWDVKLYQPGDHHASRVRFYIEDLQPAEDPDTYLAAGCMMTLATRQFAPLSLQAVDRGQGRYDLTVLSTAIPREEEPYVIRFDGQARFHRWGVRDDMAFGDWLAEIGDGRWWAGHHDRRRPHCPPSSAAIEWERDVFADQQLSGETVLSEGINLEGRAPIVSSGMQVTAPDGEVFDIPAFDDIFSPEVDFISHFRYQQGFPGLPIAGEPYHFVLLDIFGNPIPGTEATDTWYACVQDAPYALEPDLTSSAPDIDFHFTYDGFLDAAAGFDPSAAAGTYKISIYGDEFNYGTHFQSTWHRVPFTSFGEFSEFGTPDGNDFGQGLEEMPPGLHQVVLESVSDPPAGSAGLRNECFISDVGEILYMEREDTEFTFHKPALITGHVTNQLSGDPLGGIFVSACEYAPDEPQCWGMETNENGMYWISVLAGSYRVETHSDQGWVKEFWEETPVWDEADPVAVTGGEVRDGINFTLELGGSISGTVTDEDGNPLDGIAVDIEEGGYGQCTAEDGSYTLAGLPLGTYTVAAGRDFCEPHPYVEAKVEGIVLSEGAPDVSAVDFALELGGIISGVVMDSSNQPLANIGVDIQDGGYGQCTDENGQFSMRLPMGTYVIAAGRDFCGVADYAEALTDPPLTISEAEPQAYVEFFLDLAE